MKKLLILSLLAPIISSSQMISRISELSVSPKNWNSFLEIHDDYYSNVEFKSGGVVIDWIILGNGKTNMRIGRYGDSNNWGLNTERSKYEGPAFWRSRDNYVNEFGPSYAGASAYRNGKSNPNHKVQQRWYLKVNDPEKFMTAFKKFINSTEKMMGNRWITVKQYTVNNPHGSTHSVAMSGESWQELEVLRSKILSSKAAVDFINERGLVEEMGNIMYRRMRHYNNEKNSNKTFDDMW